MRETRITSAQALVADSGALMRLLEELPDAGEIRLELSKLYRRSRWARLSGRSWA
jgi:hypothetical protein